ncbi:hypothetical protein R3P38DRAFT_2795320 [Favolaschia claudopus]|uniref:Uncharacterized protein n=1 Tax=Favolaschia claudopus TaxID=2862362 RepID=A0AAW0A7I7_9AGAR
MGRKRQYTQEELQDRRAHSAWEYRQRNKAKVNEKARARMQATRAQVRAAPPAIRLGYAVRAAQHRRDYLERRRRGTNNERAAVKRLTSYNKRPSDSNHHPRVVRQDTPNSQCTQSDDELTIDEEMDLKARMRFAGP